MKIERLEIIRWGGLKDLVLELGGQHPGLHVIYGDNEAGKTTLRRAVSALLFGIPMQTPDNFRFDYRELLLGAVLRLQDGTAVAFRRKKAQKQDVVDRDGRPLDVPWLKRFKSEVGQARFEEEWSLDHGQLREGGRQLVEGRGRVGETLLSAGLGGLPVARVLAELESKAAELFAGGNASKPKVNALLRRLTALRAELSSLSQNPREVEEKHRQAEELERRERALKAELEEARKTQVDMSLVERARPALTRRSGLMQRLQALSGEPQVPADFGARRVAAVTALDGANLMLEKLDQELKQRERELGELAVDDALLSHADAIDDAWLKRERHLADLDERERLKAAAVDAVRRLASDARSVGSSEERLEALARGQWKAQEATIQRLVQALPAAEAQVEGLDREVAQAGRSIRELEEAQARLPPEVDTTALRSAYALFVEDGPPERLLAQAREFRDGQEAEAEAAFGALSRWTLPAQTLLERALPSAEEVEEHAEALGKKAALEKAEEAVRAAEALLQRKRRDRQRLEANGEVPTEEALSDARAHREAGWRLVRQSLEGSPPSDESREQWTQGANLPDAFETAVAGADRLADVLRQDTQRVTRYAQLAQDCEEAEEALRSERALRDALRTAVESAEEAWVAFWAAYEMEAASAKVMRGWLAQAARVKGMLAEAERAKATCSELEARLVRRALPVARALGLAAAGPEDLSELRQQAERALAEADEASRRRQELESALWKARQQKGDAEAEAALARARLEALRLEQRALARGLEAPEEATLPVLQAIIARVADAAQRLVQRDEEARKLAVLEQRIEEVAGAHRALASSLGAELPELVARLKTARMARAERERLKALVERAGAQLREAADKRDAAKRAIERLMEEAGTTDPAEMVRVQEANEERRDLASKLHECEEGLLQSAPDGDFESLARKVDAVTPDEARQRLTDAAEREQRVLTEHEETVRSLARLRGALDEMRGADEAAEKNAELQAVLAELREQSAGWLRHRYAVHLLRQAVERFRVENQNPILRRANALFARLTLGSFEGVDVTEDGADAELRGVRPGPGGRREFLRTEQMSDGARDQLYLALRLAALEQELEAKEPLPLVLDDVLIQLSDDRALAALEVFAELAERTQILLFTHHARIAELARSLANPRVSLHHISADGPPASRFAGVA